MSIYTITFGATYANCVESDIGKTVVQGGNSGILLWYENTEKRWQVDSASFSLGVTTITGGSAGSRTSTLMLYTVTFGSTYTPAIALDIGKTVVQGANTGTLVEFNNTTKQWSVKSAVFTSGVTTITSGTGAGTSTAIDNSTLPRAAIQNAKVSHSFVPFARYVWLEIVKVNVTVSAQVSLSGAEISIYDLDNSPAGSLGSQLQHTESHGSASYTITQLSPGNAVWIQVMLDGYEEFGLSFTMPSSNSTLPIVLETDFNI